MERKKYYFKGAVFLFDRLISNNWTGETTAISEKKALSNLLFRAKSQMGFLPSAKLTLDGKLMEV